jgi:hypothetical protein
MTVAAVTGTAFAAGSVALSPIAKMIQVLYGAGVALNDYLDKHIEDLRNAENPTVARTGCVLQEAKRGFGIGYVTSVVVIATGQFLLGNTWATLTTAATAVTLTNPIAMTCAAVGAIYYGWNALSTRERDDLLQRLSVGLEVGVELVRSVVRFVIDKTKELLTPKNIEEMKKYVRSVAALFGRTLGQVTHKLGDVVADIADAARIRAASAAGKARSIAAGTLRGRKKQVEARIEVPARAPHPGEGGDAPLVGTSEAAAQPAKRP